MRLETPAFLWKCLIFYNVLFRPLTEAIYGVNVVFMEPGTDRFRFVVGIEVLRDVNLDTSRDYECVGILVSSTVVLTSEHCVYASIVEGVNILVGSVSLSQALVFYPSWWLSYNRWAIDNQIDIYEYYNDIILIKLTQEVRANSNAEIAMLCYTFIPTPGLDVDVAGWGVTNNGQTSDILQNATLRLISNTECGDRVTALDGERTVFDNRFMCTHTYPLTLLQFGDSGGPLVYGNEVIGINVGTCPIIEELLHPERVNIHLSVRFYKNFIQDIVYNYF